MTATLSMSTDVPTAPPSVTSRDDDHTRTKRQFLGPMPQNVFTQNSFSDSEDSDDDAEGGMRRFIADHAYTFFLKTGGKEEDWGEAAERGARQEMLRRWRQTQWSKLRSKVGRKKQAEIPRWVGESFEVGELMGVSILKEEHDLRVASRASLTTHKSFTSHQSDAIKTTTTDADTFYTAHSEYTPQDDRLFLTTHPSSSGLNLNGGSEEANNNRISASSSTPLLQGVLDRSASNSPPSPSLRPTYKTAKTEGILSIASTEITPTKGKGKVVHYVESDVHSRRMASSRPKHRFPSPHRSSLRTPISQSLHIPSPKNTRFTDASVKEEPESEAEAENETEPISPREVLARTGEDVLGASAGAAVEERPVENEVDSNDRPDVVMRDRMLVRVSHCEHESIGKEFDDAKCRITRGLRHEGLGEFLVVWRKNTIELYEDYRTTMKERMVGHKHLAFKIKLDQQTTYLSLFSSVDLTFSIVCKPTPVNHVSRHRWIFHGGKGLNVFVMKHKCRSRSIDWMWKLWTYLGGTIPKFFEIHCPILDTRVRVKILDVADTVGDFKREHVIDLCRGALSKLQDWEYLIQQPILKGKALELCWRTGMKLDWIWLDDDVNGKLREWEVLYGLALKYPSRPTHLEVRIAEHYSTNLTLKDRTTLHEPVSIEGYLHRIKPNSQAKAPVYLSTHDGLLFFISPSRAHPPPAPGSKPMISYSTGFTTRNGSNQTGPGSLLEAEVHRGQSQLLDSSGFVDLRNIMAVRRAFQPTAFYKDHGMVNPTGGASAQLNTSGIRPSGMRLDIDGEGRVEWPEVGDVESDDEDEGGEEVLSKAADKTHLRMRRSFELMMRSGHVVRFEAHSRKLAIEWIKRLRALVSYWTTRHRMDARAEMELLHTATGWQRLTSPKRSRKNSSNMPELPPAPDDAASLLGPFWNWCVLDVCRPIIKTGRIFLRNGYKGQYRHSQLVLVSGNLIRFDMSRQTQMHHHRAQTINLIDAYVCSGYFAALAFPDEFDPDAPPVAKIFQDGLETNDGEEDSLFVLWYKPHTVHRASSKVGQVDIAEVKEQLHEMMNRTPIPRMTAKRKVLVCRARSQLERDSWCWALNCEIERIARITKGREQTMRSQGELDDRHNTSSRNLLRYIIA